jgi:hypothetical protein
LWRGLASGGCGSCGTICDECLPCGDSCEGCDDCLSGDGGYADAGYVVDDGTTPYEIATKLHTVTDEVADPATPASPAQPSTQRVVRRPHR